MFAEQKHSIDEVSRHVAEVKLIESRNKFMGFLRKRLNSPQDAEDVFQDFCVKVLRNHRSVKSGERLDAWLGTALRHTLIDHYRRQATRNRGAESYSIEVKVLTSEAEPEAQSACSCIAKAIHNLTPARAELLQRLDLQDEPRDTVAAEMGVSLNALGVRIHRSRAALKKEIAQICPVCGDGGFMNCDCEHSRSPARCTPAADRIGREDVRIGHDQRHITGIRFLGGAIDRTWRKPSRSCIVGPVTRVGHAARRRN